MLIMDFLLLGFDLVINLWYNTLKFKFYSFLTSSYNDGSGLGPRCVTVYLLARQENKVYYELFTDKKIEKESDMHSDGDECVEFFRSVRRRNVRRIGKIPLF